ncbi:unnamed protein product [Dovyalis caffra]|uniref:Uncharacterized protein n=1 Tax=Dovyalis caffra TaxID=77055 RepID=A0AAV1SEL5_9ROSI|nr:unnamed protein product [Dovyalis caffra]
MGQISEKQGNEILVAEKQRKSSGNEELQADNHSGIPAIESQLFLVMPICMPFFRQKYKAEDFLASAIKHTVPSLLVSLGNGNKSRKAKQNKVISTVHEAASSFVLVSPVDNPGQWTEKSKLISGSVLVVAFQRI